MPLPDEDDDPPFLPPEEEPDEPDLEPEPPEADEVLAVPAGAPEAPLLP